MITDAMVEAALHAAYGAVFGNPVTDWQRGAMVRALNAAERAAWQPIETAPKDRRILLAVSRVKTVLGTWDADRHNKTPRPLWSYSDNRTWDREHQPTHWRPLPEPPETGDST